MVLHAARAVELLEKALEVVEHDRPQARRLLAQVYSCLELTTLSREELQLLAERASLTSPPPVRYGT